MTASLFRSEAIESRRRRLWGEVVIVQPVGYGMMTAMLGFFALAGITYLVTGSYTKTETVQGYIAPTGGLAQVYASKGGTVTRVLTHEGDVVAYGQPMVELSLDTTGSDGSIGEKLRLETQVRIREIDAQVSAAQEHYQEERRRLTTRIKGIKGELADLDERLIAERGLRTLLADDAERYAELEARGNGTHIELSRRRQQVLSQDSSIHELERQRESRQGDLADTQSQLVNLPVDQAEKLAQLRSARSELQQSLAQLDVNRIYIITAPVGGRVVALQARPGQTMTGQAPLAALVPTGSDLEANLLVPTRAAGFIQPGQEVRLRIDAFPYQKFGNIYGHIDHISNATYREGELLAPINVTGSVYRVIVSLDKTSISAYGENRRLSPGMTLYSDIVIGRYNFFNWIIDPVLAIKK